MQELFGGSTSTQEPKDVTPPELQQLRSPFASAISNLFNFNNIPTYNPNATNGTGAVPTAPITSNEQTLLNTMMGQLNDPTRADLLQKTLSGYFLPGQEGSNPFLQATIEAAQRPTLQGLEETLSRALPGRFTQAGHFTNPQGSSAFDRAAAIATRGASQTLGDIATNIASGAYTSERGNQNEALKLQSQDVQTTINALQAQALPRLIQQYGIDQGMEQFKTRIQAVLQALQTASGTLVNVGQSGKSTSSNGIIPTLLNPFNINIAR